LTQLIQPT
jgi:IS30 family transposase